MTNPEELQRVEHLYRMKMIILKQAERDAQVHLLRAGEIRTELQRLENKIYTLKQSVVCGG